MNNSQFTPLSASEEAMVEGGFVPLVIFGTYYAATQVATAAGALFLAGAATGTAVALN